MKKTPELIPSTISKEAQSLLKILHNVSLTACPAIHDLEAWKAWQAESESRLAKRAQKALEYHKVQTSTLFIGKVEVLSVTPPQWSMGDPSVLFFHGGAFTSGRPFSQLPAIAPLALHSGFKILAIDYSLAPQSQYKAIQQEIISVLQELCDTGIDVQKLGIVGDSAGGNLALFAALALRDTLRLQAAALVLWSPWADLSNQGDSFLTLKEFDPILNHDLQLNICARAYAGDQSLLDPRISPLYADYRKGFPPTLIQESTRSLFLSTSVRLYRTLLKAGIDTSLDMYEGVPHGFQLMELPESLEAIRNSSNFLRKITSKA